MKKLLAALFLLFILLPGVTLHAVPAKRVVQTITQPDGTTLSVLLQGDENFHYNTTIDGFLLQEAADGFMKYATVTTQGTLSASEHIAHDPENRTEQEVTYTKEINTKSIDNAIQKIRTQKVSAQWLPTREIMKFPGQGTARGLIILAQYKDVKFAANNTRQKFNDMMNAKGFSDNGATGSARDYFIDQSSGAFTPEFDVVGPVTLPEAMSYYGGNNIYKNDQNPAKMIVDACYGADTLLNVDFSRYDFDNDGKVDLVYVIYAGYAEAQGGPASSIWPHAWDIEAAGFNKMKLDGKLIRSYACSSELQGYSGTAMDGVGTFCHEFSHCLGLPDIYDTRYSGMVGMDIWSVMDRGCYNNGSKTPAGYSAYERSSVGWLTLTPLEKAGRQIELHPLNTANQAYVITSDKNPNEYYTIENRQQTGWDAYLPGHGMMIVHVDYVPWIWDANIVNSSAAGHPHLQIVPADNEFKNLAGDLFPGAAGNQTSFTDESLPIAGLYGGGCIGKPLTKIQEHEGIITFDYLHFVSTPIATDATQITQNAFTANWRPVNNASSYTLKVNACMTGKECVSEDFTKFTEGSSTAPDAQDIANELDTYMRTPGWNGKSLYQAGTYCRIGSSSTGGSLTTPLLDLSKEKVFTLYCNAKGSKSLINGYTFELSDENGKILLNKSIMMSASEKATYWTFTTEESVGKVTIRTTAAALVNNIRIYNGDVKGLLEKGESLPTHQEYTNVIENITDNTYTVTGLADNKSYIYNVYATSDEETSKLSNKILLQTLKPTSIESIQTAKEIYTSKGLLRFTTDRSKSMRIFTPNGTTVYAGTSKEGINEMTLPEGLYILTIGTDRWKINIP